MTVFDWFVFAGTAAEEMISGGFLTREGTNITSARPYAPSF
jgi:hypothetical protein